MNKQKHFVKTSDPETAKALRDIGLQELAKEGSRWVFINEPNKMSFSSKEMKLNYTNTLTF